MNNFNQQQNITAMCFEWESKNVAIVTRNTLSKHEKIHTVQNADSYSQPLQSMLQDEKSTFHTAYKGSRGCVRIRRKRLYKMKQSEQNPLILIIVYNWFSVITTELNTSYNIVKLCSFSYYLLCFYFNCIFFPRKLFKPFPLLGTGTGYILLMFLRKFFFIEAQKKYYFFLFGDQYHFPFYKNIFTVLMCSWFPSYMV